MIKQDKALGWKVWLPLILASTLAGGMYLGIKLEEKSPKYIVGTQTNFPQTSIQYGKIEEMIRYVEAKYVDDVNREDLIQNAIDRLLEELDPHSNYISAKQLQKVNEQLEGNFEGIGVEFNIFDDTIVIIDPLAGGPSEKAGILTGDKIVTVEDSLVAGKNIDLDSVIEKLRGKKGSIVNIGVLRQNEESIQSFSIERDRIPTKSVDACYMLNDKDGYIKVNRFSATTGREFIQGIKDLTTNHGMKNLVIDLRQNPGGYLEQATRILNQLFKEKDKLFVYTEGRTVERNEYESNGRSYFDIENIVVLIDEGAASASEILAGAIQDWDRGVILGRRSYGKGLVQEQYNLRDGSALRLTVARYYTPSGRSIQKGYDDLNAYNNDMYDRFESGELIEKDSIILIDTTKYYTHKGRIVHGGGGIVPDVFIPIDTILYNESYLRIRPYISQFSFNYFNNNKNTFSRNIDDFVNNFQVDNHLYTSFLQYVKNQEETIPHLDSAVVTALKKQFKMRLGKYLFKDEGYYKVANIDDLAIKKSIQVLRLPNPLTSLEKLE